MHPWRLFAVNVENSSRRAGLQIGTDAEAKPLIASFIGAHAEHYVSDVRLRLRVLANVPGFNVQLTEKWHFEDVVYGHQVRHEPLEQSYRVDESVARYNRVLSESEFALCPSGAGANTLRLCEALAVGAIPVLLAPQPILPQGGTLPAFDWHGVVLCVADEQLAELPQILRQVPMDEVRRRQRLGMEAFALVRQQRCF